jgi:hypothetical protein
MVFMKGCHMCKEPGAVFSKFLNVFAATTSPAIGNELDHVVLEAGMSVWVPYGVVAVPVALSDIAVLVLLPVLHRNSMESTDKEGWAWLLAAWVEHAEKVKDTVPWKGFAPAITKWATESGA